jgi:hypothetical protein
MKKGRRPPPAPAKTTLNPIILMTSDNRPDMVVPEGPLTPEEKAKLRECHEAIQAAWIGEGEALSRLRHLQAHRDQRTTRGRPIPTDAGRWKAYLEQEHGLTVAEADAAMRAFHNDLARQHHSQAHPEVA